MVSPYGKKPKLTYRAAATVRDGIAALRVRSDGRAHDTGLIRPYRPVPPDFFEVYVQMGWDGLDEYYRTNWRVIRRWITLVGREKLRKARNAHVIERRAENRARRRIAT